MVQTQGDITVTEEVNIIQVREGDQWKTIIPHMAEAAIKDGTGQTITLTYATKAALTDGSVTKLGKDTVGAVNAPIYLENGVPKVCGKVMDLSTAQTITGIKTNNNHIRSYFNSEEGIQMLRTDLNLSDVANTGDKGCRLTMYGKKDNTDDYAVEERIGGIRSYMRKNGHGTMYLNVWNDQYQSSTLGLHLTRENVAYVDIPTPVSGTPSTSAVNKSYVESTDGVTNNLVHRTSDETIGGNKTMVNHLKSVNVGISGRLYVTVAGTRWYEVCRLSTENTSRYIIELAGGVNGQASLCWGKIMIVSYANNVPYGAWIERYSVANAGYIVGDCCAIVKHTATNTLSVYMKMEQWWGIDYNITDARIQSVDINPTTILVRGEFVANDLDELSGTYDILQNMVAR